MAEPISAAAAAFANWASSTYFSASVYGATAHSVIHATLYFGAQATLYAGITMGVTAIAQAQVPNPDGQKITKKQTRPPRQWIGGGPVRMSGPYFLRESQAHRMALVIGICDFRLESITGYYLNDDKVIVDSHGWVQEGEDGRYGTGDLVRIDHRLGEPVEAYYSMFEQHFGDVWPSTSTGNGIASMAVWCQHRSREGFSRHYPNGEVIPSAVAQAVCYDWRDPDQSRDDPSSWRGTENPVVWQVFLEWFLYGDDWERSIEPVLSDLTDEADYCDDMIPKKGGTEKRYTWAGGWTAETEPTAVRENLLATYDGWLTRDGRGRLVIKAGRYEEPTFTITPDMIQAYTWQRGQVDEEACNHLVISFTSPDHDYSVVECDAWTDEADILLRGRVRSEPLGLIWVCRHTQARRLAKRKMSRINAKRRGSVTTDIAGLDGLGHRFIRVQNPTLSSMANVVVEVMDVEVDLNQGLVTFEFMQADPDVDDWDPETEEGDSVPVPNKTAYEPYVESAGGFAGVVSGVDARLTWRNPADATFSAVRLYRGSTNIFTAATQLATVEGGIGALGEYIDLAPGGTKYYWITTVDSFGEESRPTGPVMLVLGKVYADYLAHIAAKATSGSRSISAQIDTAIGRVRAAMNTTPSGTMYGSSWNTIATTDSVIGRAIQHALPSSAVVAEQVSASREIYIEVVANGSQSTFNSVTRNDYVSSPYSGAWGSVRVTHAIWWSEADKKAYQCNPSIGSAVTEYPL